MEFSDFVKIIQKQKLIIIIIPVIAVIITYFLVRNQANSYSSQAKIATGIVDQTQKILNIDGDAQESKVNQEFSNIIEMLKSKRILDQLAYKLIIHDLTSNKPYRKPSAIFSQLNANAKTHAVATFTDLYKNRKGLSLFNPDQNGLNKLVASMHYDDQSILKSLLIYRIQSSDYINVQFDSENADLSAIVVNTLCAEFVDYYASITKQNQQKAVTFLANMLREKQDTLKEKMAALKAYKIKNHVLSLNEKAKNIYSQLSDFESRKEEAEKTIVSTQATIDNIDKQFNPHDRRYVESSKVVVSQQILQTKAELQAVNDKYIQSNFDPKYKAKIDSLTTVVSSQIGELSDKYVLNPLSSKQTLVDHKLNLEIQNDLAKHSTKSIDGELTRLHNEFNSLVPHEGTIQALESAVNIAGQEYLEVLQKYNQTSMTSSFSIQLKLVETAEPGVAQPTKKMLLVILSGIISFTFCFIVLFLLFFFDNTIKNPRELANKTKIPVLGHLNLLKSKSIDLRDIWNEKTGTSEMKQFKDLIQSARFEIDSELNNHKIILINSIAKAEGKTFMAINLAYAYASINKKILLIDGNFNNPDITRSVQTKFYLEDFLNDTADQSLLSGSSKITFLGNKGSDVSLLQLSNVQHITEKLAELSAAFDIIIIEAPALDALNKSKEWALFADKILTVFEAGKTITGNDKEHI
ncbi:MAG: polysaccharide biosynthesis transport protein [Mucilaginibacter sp.]|nr:polysaccharide biosynthesis transport protein [Mucilaginibacter sp.]